MPEILLKVLGYKATVEKVQDTAGMFGKKVRGYPGVDVTIRIHDRLYNPILPDPTFNGPISDWGWTIKNGKVVEDERTYCLLGMDAFESMKIDRIDLFYERHRAFLIRRD